MAATTQAQDWARLGASVRLRQIEAERDAILRAFPELRRATRHPAALLGSVRRQRQVSAAARKAMSAGMRKFWARRKGLAKGKKPTSRKPDAAAAAAKP